MASWGHESAWTLLASNAHPGSCSAALPDSWHDDSILAYLLLETC